MIEAVGPDRTGKLRSWLSLLGIAAHGAGLALVLFDGSSRLPFAVWIAYVVITFSAPLFPNWRSKGGTAATAIYPALTITLLAYVVAALT